MNTITFISYEDNRVVTPQDINRELLELTDLDLPSTHGLAAYVNDGVTRNNWLSNIIHYKDGISSLITELVTIYNSSFINTNNSAGHRMIKLIEALNYIKAKYKVQRNYIIINDL